MEEIVCKNVHFFMWDIGGQDSLRNSWNTYFADSDFVIFVVDSTDRERLPISKMEVRFFTKKLSKIFCLLKKVLEAPI